MGDGTTTRTQKDIANLQKECDRLDRKIEEAGAQIRSELKAEIKNMCDLLLAKIDGLKLREEPVSEGTDSSNRQSTLSFPTDDRKYTKHVKLECPRFNGEDFLGWYLKIE